MAEKRKRGAQPGNRNALVHGLYSASFSDEELDYIAELAKKDTADLVSEIACLRFLFARAFGMSHGKKDVDPVETLDLISEPAVRLANMLRAQRVLEGKSADSLAEAMAVALREIGEELGIG